MELIVLVIMFFTALTFMVKLSFHGIRVVVLHGLFFGAFVLMSGAYAPLQSKTQLADFLANPSLMQDLSVWICVESLLGIAFCLLYLRHITGESQRLLKYLHAFPGFLMLPMLFYLLTQSIFLFPGVDFQFITYTAAVAVLMLTILLALGIKWLVPEEGIRLEIIFISWVFTFTLSMVATVNGRTQIIASNELYLPALFAIIALALLMFALGWGWYHIRKVLFLK